MSSQNANVDNLVNNCFASLPESDAGGVGKILGESGVNDQTNSAPLFTRGQSTTSLPAEADGTADGTVSAGDGAPGGGPYFPHRHCQRDVHILVILLVINIFFSSFNDVDLLCSMLADCCMPWHQE